MFTFLWKTKNSLAFRQTVKPYVINQKEVDKYQALEDKTGIDPVEPVYVDFEDYGVFDTKIITNQEDIYEQQLSFDAMNPEEVDAIEKIQPIYQDKLDYTNYFWSLTKFDWEEFQTACENYLASLEK